MDERGDELDIELGSFSLLPNGEYQDTTKICKTEFLWMRYAPSGNLLQNLRAYPFFDKFRDTLADLGGAPAMRELATAAFIVAYLGFLAPE